MSPKRSSWRSRRFIRYIIQEQGLYEWSMRVFSIFHLNLTSLCHSGPSQGSSARASPPLKCGLVGGKETLRLWRGVEMEGTPLLCISLFLHGNNSVGPEDNCVFVSYQDPTVTAPLPVKMYLSKRHCCSVKMVKRTWLGCVGGRGHKCMDNGRSVCWC